MDNQKFIDLGKGCGCACRKDRCAACRCDHRRGGGHGRSKLAYGRFCGRAGRCVVSLDLRCRSAGSENGVNARKPRQI